jgi:hypothetical protein
MLKWIRRALKLGACLVSSGGLTVGIAIGIGNKGPVAVGPWNGAQATQPQPQPKPLAPAVDAPSGVVAAQLIDDVAFCAGELRDGLRKVDQAAERLRANEAAHDLEGVEIFRARMASAEMRVREMGSRLAGLAGKFRGISDNVRRAAASKVQGEPRAEDVSWFCDHLDGLCEAGRADRLVRERFGR